MNRLPLAVAIFLLSGPSAVLLGGADAASSGGVGAWIGSRGAALNHALSMADCALTIACANNCMDAENATEMYNNCCDGPFGPACARVDDTSTCGGCAPGGGQACLAGQWCVDIAGGEFSCTDTPQGRSSPGTPDPTKLILLDEGGGGRYVRWEADGFGGQLAWAGLNLVVRNGTASIVVYAAGAPTRDTIEAVLPGGVALAAADGVIVSAGARGVEVWERVSSSWTRTAVLAADPGRRADVATDGSIVAVSDGRSLLVFSRVGAAWIREATLPATGELALASDLLGSSNALLAAREGPIVRSYQRGPGGWAPLVELDVGGGGSERGARSSLALRERGLAVGLPGKDEVRVYELDGSAWNLRSTIHAPPDTQLIEWEEFGAAVDWEAGRLLVGAPRSDVLFVDDPAQVPSEGAGAAASFVGASGAFVLERVATAPDGARGDLFGWAVASSPIAQVDAVAAPFDFLGSYRPPGSVHVTTHAAPIPSPLRGPEPPVLGWLLPN